MFYIIYFLYFKKKFSVLILSYINTALRQSAFRIYKYNFEFFQFPLSVHVTVYQHGKKIIYFKYNTVARRNIKKEIFRFDIELYQHGS